MLSFVLRIHLDLGGFMNQLQLTGTKVLTGCPESLVTLTLVD